MKTDSRTVEIDILDVAGTVVGSKRRDTIDKLHDFVHTICILGLYNHQAILPRLNVHTGSPISSGKLGCTSATMLRHTEAPEQAAIRSLHQDFGLSNQTLVFLGSHLAPDIRRKLSAFVCYFQEIPTLVSNESSVELYSISQLPSLPKTDLSPVLDVTIQSFHNDLLNQLAR